jgi:hypothetical protein
VAFSGAKICFLLWNTSKLKINIYVLSLDGRVAVNVFYRHPAPNFIIFSYTLQDG